jgi:HEAT repeat protein
LALLSAGCTAYGPKSGEKWRELTLGDSPAVHREGLKSPDADVRRWSIVSLAREGDPASVDDILPCLTRSREPVALVRATAAAALRAVGDPRALPALTAACRDSDAAVRAEAAKSVGALGGPDNIPILARLLWNPGDSDSEVRLEATRALERIGEKAVPDLIHTLDDPSESVVFAGHTALMRLTGQTLPASKKDWQDYLKTR